MKMLRMVLTLAFSLMAGAVWATGAGAAPAANGATVDGVWQTTDRNMDYTFSYCGDGKELCITLTGIRQGADNARNRPFLHTSILNRGKPAGTNSWKGTVHIMGRSASGTLKFFPNEKVEISGCAFFVVCDTITLIPAL